jgi:hypothetical protein
MKTIIGVVLALLILLGAFIQLLLREPETRITDQIIGYACVDDEQQEAQRTYYFQCVDTAIHMEGDLTKHMKYCMSASKRMSCTPQTIEVKQYKRFGKWHTMDEIK